MCTRQSFDHALHTRDQAAEVLRPILGPRSHLVDVSVTARGSPVESSGHRLSPRRVPGFRGGAVATAVLMLWSSIGCAQVASKPGREASLESASSSSGDQKGPGCAKRDALWSKVLATRQSAPAELRPVSVLKLMPQYLRNKVDWRGDEIPPGHKKAIHATGVVAKVRYEGIPDHGLTGLFAAADVCGLLRMSLTQPPGDIAPGLALKLFVDGRPSENVSALVALDGQGKNYNFFAHDMATMVGPSAQIKGRISSLLFRFVTRHPRALGLSRFAMVSPEGAMVTAPRYPYALYFVPDDSVQRRFTKEEHNPLEDLLTITPESLGSGSGILYEVWAPVPEANTKAAAQAALDRAEEGQDRRKDGSRLVGRLRLEARPEASTFGDESLFFVHERYEGE